MPRPDRLASAKAQGEGLHHGNRAPVTPPARRGAVAWTLWSSDAVALSVVAAELAAMFVGATLPTPLYPLYREAGALAIGAKYAPRR